MNFAVTFEDNTCPICGIGKLELSKNIQDPKHIYTEGFICNSCGGKFFIEWIPDSENVYHPHPLYDETKAETLKKYFTQKGEKYENKKYNDRDFGKNQSVWEENRQQTNRGWNSIPNSVVGKFGKKFIPKYSGHSSFRSGGKHCKFI